MKIKGKVALITGGARIGQTVAERLGAGGCHVAVAWRRSRAAAEETVNRVKTHGVRCQAFRADLQNEKDCASLVERVEKSLGRLDILIAMASLYEKTPVKMLGVKEWEANMNANLRSTYLLALAVAPLMKTAGGGRIVTIADWIAASGRPRYKDYLPYYVSKHGVIGLTEGLALELAPEILVNCVAPGPIVPPKGATEKERREVVRSTPLRRWGGADEIARAVLFLIETDFVTGECIRVDGGRHLR